MFILSMKIKAYKTTPYTAHNIHAGGDIYIEVADIVNNQNNRSILHCRRSILYSK